MTLIELLVVVVIMTTIVAAAIPLLSPANDDRRLREATRGLNTYITGAQARAISSNRPCGIAIKRLGQDTKRAEDNGVCLEVFYVEQPPPYAGFDANSRACVAIHPTVTGLCLIRFVTRGATTDSLPVGWDADLFPTGTIRPGDIMEINGTRFELLDSQNTYLQSDSNGFFVSSGSGVPTILARPANDSGQQINPKFDNNGVELGATTSADPPYWASPAPYQVLRQPTPSGDQPYQLPEGTAIDLRASGIGSVAYFHNSDYPDLSNAPDLVNNSGGILIMFAPEGRVARVSYTKNPNNGSETFDRPVVDNVYLLIGRRDRIAAPAIGTDPTLQTAAVTAATTDVERAKLNEPINWLNGASRWIVIGSQSGRIATIENAAVNPQKILDDNANASNPLPESSEELRNVQILAAREFTREMARQGGR